METTSSSCNNQDSVHQEEKSPNHQVGMEEGSRRGWWIWDSVLSPKALAPTRRTITKRGKEKEMLPVASHRSGDRDLITAEQSSRSCTGWLPQYLRLSAQDAVLVPKSHLRDPLLGGRTTQRLAADPRRPPAGELPPTEPGFPACRQACPGSPRPPAAASGTLSTGPLHRTGIMHLARGFPFERALQMFN